MLEVLQPPMAGLKDLMTENPPFHAQDKTLEVICSIA